ncbi:MAG: hypothetical protein LBD21_00195 [Tannerellaceae bacterium]|jgi:hypothetical protein|nr:hypothetical protein [Tannerellaceae bacterium]
MMREVKGITIERNSKGDPCSATINLEMYGEKLMPFFKEVGIDEDFSPYSRKYVNMIRNAENDIMEGKGTKIAIEDLWK